GRRVDHPRDAVSNERELRIRQRRAERDRDREAFLQDRAADAPVETSGAGCSEGLVDHSPDVELQPGARRADRKRAAGTDELDRLPKARREARLEERPRLSSLEPADRDAADGHAAGDDVGLAPVPEIRGRGSGRDRETPGGEQDPGYNPGATVHSSARWTPLV